MRSLPRSLLVAVAALLLFNSSATLAAPSVSVRRVAVLDFNATWTGRCAVPSLDDAKRERCEILRLFADEARGGALTVLRPPAYVVMTRENTAQILKDMGGKCSDGECEVETARLLGASLVVSGEVTLLEGSYVVSLKVHDVTSAALLGTGRTRAKTKLDAFDNVRAETERMLRAAVELEGAVAAAPAPPAAKPEAKVEAEPSPPPVSAAKLADVPPTRAESGAREKREYGEVAAGLVVAPSLAGSSFESGDVRGGGVGFMGMIRAGHRLGRELAVEGSLLLYRPNRYERIFHTVTSWTMPGTLEPKTAYLAGVSAVWSPAGSRWLSLGLGAGAGPWGVTLTSNSKKVDAEWIAPYVLADVRIDYPLGAFTLGLRAGFLAVFVLEDVKLVEPTSSASLTLGKGSGRIQAVPISLALRYPF